SLLICNALMPASPPNTTRTMTMAMMICFFMLVLQKIAYLFEHPAACAGEEQIHNVPRGQAVGLEIRYDEVGHQQEIAQAVKAERHLLGVEAFFQLAALLRALDE